MFSELLKDVPRGIKMVIGATLALAIFLFLRGHLYYFRNPMYLGGLIVIEIVLTCLWHFEIVFFPLLMVTFLWAGISSRVILIRWAGDSQISFFATGSIELHSTLPIWMKCFAPLDSGMSKSPERGRAECTGNEYLRMIRRFT